MQFTGNTTIKLAKTLVFNVVILDKSRPMGSVRTAAIDAFDEEKYKV